MYCQARMTPSAAAETRAREASTVVTSAAVVVAALVSS